MRRRRTTEEGKSGIATKIAVFVNNLQKKIASLPPPETEREREREQSAKSRNERSGEEETFLAFVAVVAVAENRIAGAAQSSSFAMIFLVFRVRPGRRRRRPRVLHHTQDVSGDFETVGGSRKEIKSRFCLPKFDPLAKLNEQLQRTHIICQPNWRNKSHKYEQKRIAGQTVSAPYHAESHAAVVQCLGYLSCIVRR